MEKVSFNKYQNKLSFKNKLGRLIWNIYYALLFRPFSLPIFNKYRIFILKLFGAKIGRRCRIDSTVKVWAPWNLRVGDFVAIGFDVRIYNPGLVIIHNKVVISQNAHLCTASHNYESKDNELITAPINIKDYAWVATDSFVSMGVMINEGAIVGATASVYKDVDSWSVVGGNPAKFIKKRVIK